jgi:hypothetical protein
MAIRSKCYNTCFHLHDRFSIRKLFLVLHGTLRILSWWAEPIHIWIWMPNMKNFTTMCYYDWSKLGYLQNEASAREIATCKQNVGQKEDFMHSFFQMDWCSVYLTPQDLPKYIYLSPPLIFPTTYNGIRTKNRPGVNHSGRCSHTLNGTDS